MSKQENNQAEQASPNALTAAEQKKRELVNFVANNILNGLTLNQTIQVVQQVAMRDANVIVSEADEDKLKEIEQAYANAQAQAQAQAEAAADTQAEEQAPAKKGAKKSASRGRKTAKKATA